MTTCGEFLILLLFINHYFQSRSSTFNQTSAFKEMISAYCKILREKKRNNNEKCFNSGCTGTLCMLTNSLNFSWGMCLVDCWFVIDGAVIIGNVALRLWSDLTVFSAYANIFIWSASIFIYALKTTFLIQEFALLRSNVNAKKNYKKYFKKTIRSQHFCCGQNNVQRTICNFDFVFCLSNQKEN